MRRRLAIHHTATSTTSRAASSTEQALYPQGLWMMRRAVSVRSDASTRPSGRTSTRPILRNRRPRAIHSGTIRLGPGATRRPPRHDTADERGRIRSPDHVRPAASRFTTSPLPRRIAADPSRTLNVTLVTHTHDVQPQAVLEVGSGARRSSPSAASPAAWPPRSDILAISRPTRCPPRRDRGTPARRARGCRARDTPSKLAQRAFSPPAR